MQDVRRVCGEQTNICRLCVGCENMYSVCVYRMCADCLQGVCRVCVESVQGECGMCIECE